jgi:ribonuclease P protein component
MMPDGTKKDEMRLIQFGRFGTAKFAKSERLRLASGFNHVKQTGVKYAGSFLVIVVADAGVSFPRIGIICGKKLSKSAPVRNRVKRMIREIFRLTKIKLEPCDMLIIPRFTAIQSKAQTLQADFIQLMKRAGKWKKK